MKVLHQADRELVNSDLQLIQQNVVEHPVLYNEKCVGIRGTLCWVFFYYKIRGVFTLLGEKCQWEVEVVV